MNIHELLKVFLNESNNKELMLHACMLTGNREDALDYYVIPTTWANITMFDVKGTSLYPTLLYAVIGILVINLALRFTAVHLIKNRQVEIISH